MPPAADAVVLDWTEKHRPRTLTDLVGNSKAVDELLKWARAWQKGVPEKQRAVILAGEPGVGKTTAAHALASDMGWGVIELNASDQRNADAIRRVAGSGAVNRAFSFGSEGATEQAGTGIFRGGRQLIILDEADNMSGTTDRGGLRTITETIRETKQPMVLIANDYYDLTRRASSLRSLCLTIKFTRVHSRSIPPALKRIADAEGVELDAGVAEAVAERAGGDLRSAVNDLQALATERDRIALDDVGALGARDATGDVWGLMGKIFYGRDAADARAAARHVDETPDHIALWVDENLPVLYADKADLVEAYDVLSRADVYLGRVSRRQQYGLWAYASTLMTMGVSAAKTGRPAGARFGFPRWLSKMSASRATREMRNNVARKVGAFTHTSLGVSRGEMLPFLREILDRDAAFAAWAVWKLRFTADEIAWLMGTKPTTAKVKKIMDAADALGPQAAPEPEGGGFGRFGSTDDGEEAGEDAGAGGGEDAEAPSTAPAGKDEEKAGGKGGRTTSLFDF